ncbi:hypothetical protein [Paenibacillus elgii]|uniref:hypothetical protein n=1 Tax=Paenibacillus elgii TaxID=189691 RepID=UPI0013CFFAEF|nr:hypothetical protein [Paenibacillus elgii]
MSFIFVFPDDQSPKLPIDADRRSVKPKVIGSPEEVTLQVVRFQQHLLFDPKVSEKIQSCFERPVVAYKHDTHYGKDDPMYPLYSVILEKDDGYEMTSVHHKFKETYFFGDRVMYRKSMWSMGQDRWTWRTFEDADKAVRWLNINCRDDDWEATWKKQGFGGRPENVWCWLYDRGIFK